MMLTLVGLRKTAGNLRVEPSLASNTSLRAIVPLLQQSVRIAYLYNTSIPYHPLQDQQ
jgi:hypothetical protein